MCVVPTTEAWWEGQHANCAEAVPECELEASSRRWPLGRFSNTHRRALLGNSDGAAPWGNPEPPGRNPVWAK
eukprot:5896605-Alexandrium_andersonii.AAC.1